MRKTGTYSVGVGVLEEAESREPRFEFLRPRPKQSLALLQVEMEHAAYHGTLIHSRGYLMSTVLAPGALPSGLQASLNAGSRRLRLKPGLSKVITRVSRGRSLEGLHCPSEARLDGGCCLRPLPQEGEMVVEVCISGPVTGRGKWKKTWKLWVVTNVYYSTRGPGILPTNKGVHSQSVITWNPLQPQQVSSDTLHPALVEVHRNLRRKYTFALAT